jgi:hypothetical protein
MDLIVEPPFSEWGDILKKNIITSAQCRVALGAERVMEFREELHAAARKYSELIKSTAAGVGLSVQLACDPALSPNSPIVMAGHQPIIYHPGILYKTDLLSRCSAEHGAYGVNLVIDTDEGDGGLLSWPRVEGADVTIKRASIGIGGSMYCDQRVAESQTVRKIFDEMKGDLAHSGCAAAVGNVERVADMYGRLSGVPIALSNAVVRMTQHRPHFDEVPLSWLIQGPIFRRELLGLITDPERFVSLYNKTLESFRAERKIKNPANPFPNMRRIDSNVELPLWELKEGERKPLSVDPSLKILDLDARLLAPRGSIVTLLARSFGSDLFIHGLGGAKYEPFVDTFALSALGVALPQFVVASVTRHLFPDQIKRLSEARHIKSRYKEVVSRTDSFFGLGLFSEADEGELKPLVQRRKEQLKAMESVQSPAERSQVAHSLNEINREVKARIEVSTLAPVLALGGVDDGTFARWTYREFPFFLFDA